MLHKAEGFDRRKFTMAGILVAMGVVYGDIGTSPLYVMKAIVGDNGGLARVSESFILGSVSLIFWTLTILTTIKYVVIALNADNHGEGGIFSLYTLVRKKSKYLIIPAMIGGAALLADGVFTPAVTVTTAIEGLRGIPAFFERFGNDDYSGYYVDDYFNSFFCSTIWNRIGRESFWADYVLVVYFFRHHWFNEF